VNHSSSFIGYYLICWFGRIRWNYFFVVSFLLLVKES